MRDERLDIVKGIGAIMVVMGHAIQRTLMVGGFPNITFFENGVFSFIYSFHMPLFMIISGFLFFGSSEKYDSKIILSSRIFSLIMPIFIWRYSVNTVLMLMGSIELSVPGFIIYPFIDMWFFWAIFFSSIGVLIGKTVFNDNFLFHTIVMVILLITPDILNKEFYAFTYPFFIFGYFANKKGFKIENIKLPICLTIFAISFVFWNAESYIYTTGATLLGRESMLTVLIINIYRFAIGIFGSLSLIKIVDNIYVRNKLNLGLISELGKKSMGIYFLEVYIGVYMFNFIPMPSGFKEGTYTMISILITPIILFIYTIILRIIESKKISRQLLLGAVK